MRKQIRKISFILVVAMLVSVFAPASYAEAAAEPYLAYQTTEDGAAVNKLDSAAAKEEYRVEKLLMSPGDKVDLCFINAGSWKNSKWTSSDTNVVTIDGKGLITAKNPGVSEITLTYKKKLTNKKVTVKTKVYVGEEAWGVSIGTTSFFTEMETYRLKVGGDIDFNVYGIPEIDSWNYSVSWESSNKKAAEMIGSILYARKEGKAEITATIKNKATGKVIKRKVNVEVTAPVKSVPDIWDNEYYRMYGENYKRLFSAGVLSCTYEIEEDMLDEARVVLDKKIKKISGSGLLELTDIANALAISFEGIFKGKDSLTEKNRLEAIQYLIQELTDDSVHEQYVNNVQDALVKTKDIFASMKNLNDFEEAVKKIEEAGLDLEKNEVNSIITYFRNDAAGDISKVLSEGVTLSEYMISTICLYEADEKLLDDLQRCSEPGESLYEDIELLKREREKNPEKYFKQQYVGDLAGRAISKALLKLAGKPATEIFDAVDAVVSMGADMMGVSGLSDVAEATYLMGYVAGVSDKIMEYRLTIKESYDKYTNEELREKIEEYEFLYNTYLAMIEPVCESVKKLEKEWNQELGRDSLIPRNGYDYNRHIAEAMCFYYNANLSAEENETVKDICIDVQDKMDLLLKKLGVENGKIVYFTVNKKACHTTRDTGHGCTNCNVGDIIKASWFKKIFGTINTSLFPYHDVNANRRDHAGQSCFGFACFAQWYVYADSVTDKIVAQNVAKMTYNKVNLQAIVKPGDIIRVNGHSMLIYEVEENGLRVIDCNWNMGGQLNCVVQKHLVPYTHKDFAGYTVYVNRVGGTEIDTTITKIEDTANGQIGYLDLSAKGWTAYNVGLDVEMNADKAYTIYQGSMLKILGTYINSKGNKIYHVYSESLEMNCYVSAKYVTLVDTLMITPAPKPVVIPVPTVTPKPTVTQKPTVTPNVTTAPEKQYGYLDLRAKGWTAYNVGLNVEMNADKAYTIYQGSKFEILGKYTNSKGNQIYHVYSESLGMECYVSASVVALGEAPTKIYGILDLSSKGWSAYNVGLDVEMNADKAYTIYNGAQLEILGTYTNSKGNQICHVYSADLKRECYVTAKYVNILR